MTKNLSSPNSLTIRSYSLAISPQKFRPVVNSVRGKEINHSLNILHFLPHKGARMLHKILQGAVKQVEKKSEKEKKNFYISQIKVDQGEIRKKLMIRAKGSANTLRKPTSHLFLCISSDEAKKTNTKNLMEKNKKKQNIKEGSK
jgi:large subunit ribosomal protein L22